MREPRGSVTSLQGPEDDLLSGLLGSGAADSALGSWELRVKTRLSHVDTT